MPLPAHSLSLACPPGCLFAELLTGQPLFPGSSNLDQLALIVNCFGHLPNRLLAKALTNPHLAGVQLRTGNPKNWAVALQQRCAALRARGRRRAGAHGGATRRKGGGRGAACDDHSLALFACCIACAPCPLG